VGKSTAYSCSGRKPAADLWDRISEMRWRAIPAVCITIASLLRAERPPIRSYTTADGLAANHIDRIVADSRGFLWFCTPEGLSRFDGYRFVNYTQEDGLPGNRILSMLETPSCDYYIGTNRGLRWFSRAGNGARFLSFHRRPGFREGPFRP